jgi:2-dehydro-3-deoxyphosphogluconate aldolase/(4S)-4-hydroxy-2-oxoglutarate aldolase
MDAKQLVASWSCPVIPVVVIDHIDHALPLAESLLEAGIAALEITLRTDVGLEAIRAMKAAMPEAVIGAGTVCSAPQFSAAAEAGADFIVSPGSTEALFSAASEHKMPFFPGAVTGSEIMTAMAHGYSTLKFFPAEASGGVAALQAFAGPFPDVQFMPTGGITPESVLSYTALSNVAAVGGSWMTPKGLVHSGQWTRIRDIARDTVLRCQSHPAGNAS